MQLYRKGVETLNKFMELGMTVSELGLASAQTIFYRNAFMQQGAATPRWQEQEAQTMMFEKIAAAQEGNQALWKGWMNINHSVVRAWQDGLHHLNDLNVAVTSADLQSAQSQWIKFTEDCVSENFRLSNEILETLEKSIQPACHSAAENAERLSVKYLG
ncbi:MAG: hypothetical protein CSB47_02335 [Proteobacteria bacterium]|nr:MAG: hypothetical protein CSB47_02335 [Pseudomonadota bacterium]